MSNSFVTVILASIFIGYAHTTNSDIPTYIANTSDAFLISSPNYPYYYPHNHRSSWIITAEDGISFILHFLEFDIQPQNDLLTINKLGTSILELSSWLPSDVAVVIEAPVISMTFTSDIATARTGFQLQIERIDRKVPCKENAWCDDGTVCLDDTLICPSHPHCWNSTYTCEICHKVDFACHSGLGCVDKSLVCDGFTQCIDGSDEWNCFTCGEETVMNISDTGPMYLSTPHYPRNYPSEANCVWYFIENTPGTFIITVLDLQSEWFDRLLIGRGRNVSDDFGVRLALWYFPKTILIDEMEIWVNFVSNHAVTFRGFLLQIERKQSNVSCLPDEYVCNIGYGCLDPSLLCSVTSECLWGAEEWDCEYCREEWLSISKESTTEVQSPFYPLYYPIGLHCVWNVESTTRDGFLFITFIELQTHPFEDFLTIGIGTNQTEDNRVIHLSGFDTPNTATVNDTSMWIIFTSGVSGGLWAGFKLTLEWRASYVPCKDSEIQCSSGYGCLSHHLICDSMPQCMPTTDEEGCDLCGMSTLDVPPMSIMNLTSPYYPQQFPLFRNCTWNISTPYEGTIKIDFKDLQAGLNYDELYIARQNATILLDLDEPVLTDDVVMYTGTQYPRMILVQESDFRFVWDADYWTEGGRGFWLQLSLEESNATCALDDFLCPVPFGLVCIHAHQKCDGRPLCPNGYDEEDCGACGASNIFLDNDPVNFTSAGYPFEYISDLDCQWVIVGGDMMAVVVRINDFDVESRYDYLEIGSGGAVDMMSFGKVSGNTKLRVFTAVDSHMWMRFTTDSTGNMRGFNLKIKQISINSLYDLCTEDEFECDTGFCITNEGKCDGFTDCLVNINDESHCAYIHCPGSYLCEKVPGMNISKCVIMDEVCEGQEACPGGDDETGCDIKKCPDQCTCKYETDLSFTTTCVQGWSFETVNEVAATTSNLQLSGGDIHSLSVALFKGFLRLEAMSLEGNSFRKLHRDSFYGLNNLTWLDLSRNNLSALEEMIFYPLSGLRELYLWNVPLSVIESNAFKGLSNLNTLILVRQENHRKTLEVDIGSFNGIDRLQTLYIDDHRICCHFNHLDNCITLEPQPPLFMCGSLMQNQFLRISMWILGLSAFIGNLYVIIIRTHTRRTSRTGAKQSFLVGNLAVSDFIMGIYMVILASVDVYYGEEYFLYSDEWRSSFLCKVESFLSLLSSEASVLFLTLITIDRFINIVFPFGFFKLGVKSCKIISVIIWLLSFILGFVPTLLAGPDSDYYDLSDVCIGLPLITRPSTYRITSSRVGQNTMASNSQQSFTLPVPDGFQPAWYFSIAIFLCFNFICFVLIFVLYCGIFINIKMVRMQVNASRDDDLKLTIKMAAIVGTDFLCWMPVIIMGILSQTGAAVIPLQMFTWSVVFILPINSSINPYLYTLATVISEYRRKEKHTSVMSMSTEVNNHSTEVNNLRTDVNNHSNI